MPALLAPPLLVAPRVDAQESATPAPARAPRPPGPLALSLTISGGVSLGSHEAGFLYYLTELQKRNPRAFQIVTVTGASAGSINALITVLEGCAPPVADPFRSLFFRTWIPIGVQQLFVPEETTPAGVFSRRAFAGSVAGLEAAWNQGLPSSCDVVLGIATTRLEPVPLTLRRGELRLPRLEERFAVRIRGEGAGKPPRATHYADPRVALEQPLLPLDGPTANPFAAVRDALFASSAFPIAFPPVPLRHCMAVGTTAGAPLRCTPEDASAALFIDGGVFDNQPLPLAAAVARAGLTREPSGRFVWAERPDAERRLLPEDFAFGYLDPAAKAYPPLPTEAKRPDSSALAMLGQFLGTFVSGARAKGLVSFFADHPDLRERMIVATTHYPLASEAMEAFFGFFEEDFRRFDFVLGMLDARNAALSSDHLQRLALWDAPPVLPEQDVEALPKEQVPEGYAAFLCARAVLEEAGDAEARCADPSLQNVRVLLQATLERLYDHCHSLREAKYDALPQHRACLAAFRGATPPPVPKVGTLPAGRWRKGVAETELDYFLRLLASHGFWFRDLGLKVREGERAPLAVRDQLVTMINRFRDVQPEGRIILDAAATALNTLRYVPARHILHASLGPVFEVGYSYTNPRGAVPALRAAAAVKLEGVTSVASNTGTYYVGLSPMLGLEVEPLPLNGATTQLRFGTRGGVLLASGDSLGTSACVPGSVAPCTRPVVDVFVALSIVERVRLQLAGVVSPMVRDTESVLWSIQPSIGLQLEP